MLHVHKLDAQHAPLIPVLLVLMATLWIPLLALAKDVILDVKPVPEPELAQLVLVDISLMLELVLLAQMDALPVNLQLNVPLVLINTF